MKKTIGLLSLVFALSISANAQENAKNDPRFLAKNELKALTAEIELNNDLAVLINDLLIYKHENVAKSPAQKEEIATMIEGKLKGSLTPEQFEKVKKNKTLLKDLKY